MIGVDEAIQRIRAAFAVLEPERVPLDKAAGRILAVDAIAKVDQPPAPVSAMDGYAMRFEDARDAGRTLRVVGTAPAGHPFGGKLEPGQAVRIFTGGVIPTGADAILIQENAEVRGEEIVTLAPASPRHIRAAAVDFRRGATLVRAGRRLAARDISLVAAGDLTHVEVRRKPRVAIAATGDELARPGEPRAAGGVVASSLYGVCALVEQWGGAAQDLGILRDTAEAIGELPALAGGADLIVTLGGASVGDHDLVQRALEPKGFILDFWKIAMRPGKPLIFGRLGETPLIGLPGNPVSAMVCAILFVRAALEAMLGTVREQHLLSARSAVSLGANDSRQDYIRARLEVREGELWVEPFSVQDSSALSVLAASQCLLVRPAHAVPISIGAPVSVLMLDDA
jgi:molybdopterin molybdotransferase